LATIFNFCPNCSIFDQNFRVLTKIFNFCPYYSIFAIFFRFLTKFFRFVTKIFDFDKFSILTTFWHPLPWFTKMVDFWPTFSILTNSRFWQHFDTIYHGSPKWSIFDQHFRCLIKICDFGAKFSIFEQNWTTLVLIFDYFFFSFLLNFYFWPLFSRILTIF